MHHPAQSRSATPLLTNTFVPSHSLHSTCSKWRMPSLISSPPSSSSTQAAYGAGTVGSHISPARRQHMVRALLAVTFLQHVGSMVQALLAVTFLQHVGSMVRALLAVTFLQHVGSMVRALLAVTFLPQRYLLLCCPCEQACMFCECVDVCVSALVSARTCVHTRAPLGPLPL